MSTTELARRHQALEPRWTEDQVALIKRTVAKGVTDDELALFLHQCKRTGLDPLSRQMYCIRRRDGDEYKATFQTGIDGYRLIADRTGLCAGNDDPVFSGATPIGGYPQAASVTVWKIVGGQRCPFTATARWDEYYPGDKQGIMWRRMPYLMLGKVAEALALRKAFPADLSGVYTHEELDQASRPERTARTARALPSDLPDQPVRGGSWAGHEGSGDAAPRRIPQQAPGTPAPSEGAPGTPLGRSRDTLLTRFAELTQEANALGVAYEPLSDGANVAEITAAGAALRQQVEAAKARAGEAPQAQGRQP